MRYIAYIELELIMVIMVGALWTGVRVAEGAKLETLCASKGYRGFESRPVRHVERSGVKAASFLSQIAFHQV